jgi:peptidoglycan/LPS O-acetylase OafA/YrhL
VRSRPSHRPEIDGLRAVAVLPVILFHAHVPGFSGGFVGVDVFFVISGFLITTIIAEALDDGRFSFLDFYARRARRILPALTVVVLATLPAAWLIMLPEGFKQFAKSVAAVGGFSSNVLFWMKSGYFDTAAELKPLLHTWSLAVEEQYYVLFPALMLALWRFGRASVVNALIGIFVVSLGLSQWMAHAHPDANFYLLPSRAWELMVGSLAALWAMRKRALGGGAEDHGAPGLGLGAKVDGGLALLGLALILASIFIYDETTPFPSLWALVPTVGTALVLLCADASGTLAGRLLSLRGPVSIGLISYSAYLWHQPIFALTRIRAFGQPPVRIMLALSALSLALAWASWRFVEVPFRRARGRVRAVVLGAIASFALVCLGGGLVATGVQKRAFMASLSPSRRTTLARIEAEPKIVVRDDGACRFGVPDVPNASSHQRFDACVATHGKALIVLGDSHSVNLQRALIAAGGAPEFLVNVDKGADCEPLAQPRCLSGTAVAFLERHARGIKAVLYEQAGFHLLLDAAGKASGRAIFLNHETPVATANRPALDGVATYLVGLRKRIDGPVVWVGPWLEPNVMAEQMLAFDCADAPRDMRLGPGQADIFERLDKVAAIAAAAHEVPYVSAVSAIDFHAGRDILDCENVYWKDGDHFSEVGGRRFGLRLAPAIDSALAVPAPLSRADKPG